MSNKTQLSIIIPCYNEASRGNFSKRLYNLLCSTKSITDLHEVIFSLDGCSDNTYTILNDFIKSRNFKHWHIIDNPINRGKGYAIRTGIEMAKGEYILFMDADLSVSLDNLLKFYQLKDNNTCIIGSRYLKDSHIITPVPMKRKYISVLSKIATRPLLKKRIKDTQCGFKLFPKTAIEKHIHTMRCDKWLFDVELLMILISQKIIIKEIPVSWSNYTSSNINKAALRDSIDELKLLYRITYRRKKKC